MGRTYVPLHRLARTIRSKNAGAHYYTMDIIFDEPETYEWVVESGAITKESVAALYGIPPERIFQFVEYRPGTAIKISIRRPFSSGDVGDADVYGCQQYVPLLEIPIPWDEHMPLPGAARGE
ncbi:MAG: DUF4387 domain-containing protein [Chloroflexi bacterium]|nr:DUF4387 domain-containing protein [Chloroflexota bacterium]